MRSLGLCRIQSVDGEAESDTDLVSRQRSPNKSEKAFGRKRGAIDLVIADPARFARPGLYDARIRLPRQRQIDFVRELFARAIPMFGSCWGQLATVPPEARSTSIPGAGRRLLDERSREGAKIALGLARKLSSSQRRRHG
jgi:hypothetical protein